MARSETFLPHRVGSRRPRLDGAGPMDHITAECDVLVQAIAYRFDVGVVQ